MVPELCFSSLFCLEHGEVIGSVADATRASAQLAGGTFVVLYLTADGLISAPPGRPVQQEYPVMNSN